MQLPTCPLPTKVSSFYQAAQSMIQPQINSWVLLKTESFLFPLLVGGLGVLPCSQSESLRAFLPPAPTPHLQTISKPYWPCLQSITRIDHFSSLPHLLVWVTTINSPEFSRRSPLTNPPTPFFPSLKPKTSPGTPWFQIFLGACPFHVESQPKSIPGLQALRDMPCLSCLTCTLPTIPATPQAGQELSNAQLLFLQLSAGPAPSLPSSHSWMPRKPSLTPPPCFALLFFTGQTM